MDMQPPPQHHVFLPVVVSNSHNICHEFYVRCSPIERIGDQLWYIADENEFNTMLSRDFIYLDGVPWLRVSYHSCDNLVVDPQYTIVYTVTNSGEYRWWEVE